MFILIPVLLYINDGRLWVMSFVAALGKASTEWGQGDVHLFHQIPLTLKT
jgi:hypothetical protein